MSPRSKKESARIRQNTRELIVETALRVFAENGFETTTVEQVTNEAGISKGLVYNYFSSKEELLKEILHKGVNIFQEILMIEKEITDPAEKLKIILDNFVSALRGNLYFWRLYMHIISQPSISYVLEDFKKFYEQNFFPKLSEIFFLLLSKKMTEEEIISEIALFAAFLDGIAFDFVIMGEDYPLEQIAARLSRHYL
jgi:AcrR family transcriptional regulator